MERDETSALPGFERLVLPDVDRAGAQDFTPKEYTGVRIRQEYPRVFNSVARALFFYKLPVRLCADLFSMNCGCVSAIRDMVIAEASTDPRAAFLVNSRRQSQRDIILSRLTELLAERLDDAEAVKEMSISEITAVLSRLESAPAARNGTDAPKTNAKTNDGNIIDVDGFDAVIAKLDETDNRLDAAEKNAPEGCAPASGESVGIASRNDGANNDFSFQLSNTTPKTLGENATLCRTLRNGDVEGCGTAPGEDTARQGAGGMPGAERAGV